MELWNAYVRDDDRPGTELTPSFGPVPHLRRADGIVIFSIQPPFYCDDVQLMYSKIMNEKLTPPKKIGEVRDDVTTS